MPSSHSRDASITTFNNDINPNFSFPPSKECRRSTDFQFPPVYSSTAVPFSFPPSRKGPGSSSNTGIGSNSAMPRSNNSDALNKWGVNSNAPDTSESESANAPSPAYTTSAPRSGGPTTPYYPGSASTTVRTIGDNISPLNPPIRLDPVPRKAGSHSRDTKEEDDRPVIQKRAPPPPGVNPRKGHAHRRSGAVSSSDVWSLMNQSAPTLSLPPKASSPESADEPGEMASSEPSPESSPKLSWSAPVSPGLPPNSSPEPSTPTLESDSSSAAQKRQNRVSFYEEVEIIPRPISSGTESGSTRTVKGHHGRDSIGSATAPMASGFNVAVRNPSTVPRRHGRTRSNSQTLTQPTAALRSVCRRPSTAGAILLSVETPAIPTIEIPDISSLRRPSSASPIGYTSSETFSTPQPLSKKKSHKKSRSDFGLLSFNEMKSEKTPRPPFATSPDKKSKKGKKQIKNWAGNILGKGKQLKPSKRNRKTRSKRAPTPPLPPSEFLEPGENEWVTTSWNDSYVIMPVDNPPVLDAPIVSVLGANPVIDLDAALKPFKATVETNIGFAAARRRMHSAASRPSGAYMHRRSESMPEMQLFALEENDDRPTMEDVFEETEDEDEDDEESDESTSDDDSDDEVGSDDGLGIEFRAGEGEVTGWVQKIDDDSVKTSAVDRRVGSGTITTITVSTPSPDLECAPKQPPSPRRKAAPADIITPLTPEQSSTSTVTASSQPPFIVPSLDSPLTFVTASSNVNTPVQLEFPKDSSSGCFDPYRDYLGEPGPEMKLSVDDIPSLTSSSSTMTMNALYLGMPSTPSTNDILPSPSLCEGKEKKDKWKRWSRVWNFWRTK